MLVADEDVPGLYQQLLASAKQTIAIWDPYYYKNCNGIFGDIQQDNIYIEILTICQGLDMKPDINDFANKVMKSIDKKKVPHCKVRVYAFFMILELTFISASWSISISVRFQDQTPYVIPLSLR